VILKGAGNKFAAGLDIKTMMYAIVEGNKGNDSDKFRQIGAETIIKLAEMKPTLVSFWDGIVLGGGVEISIYSDIKVATENTVFGMPENKLGFCNNVGAGAYLLKMRNRIDCG